MGTWCFFFHVSNRHEVLWKTYMTFETCQVFMLWCYLFICSYPRVVTSGRRPSQPPQVTTSTRSWWQLPICLPGVHERGVPGVPSSLRHSLHRWHPDLLPELGRTSPPRQAGPGASPETPSLPEAWEVWVPLLHGAVPWIHPQCIWHPNGPGEGPGHPWLAPATVH